MSQLALFGGPKAIDKTPPAELFRWPIITQEDEDAVLEVFRRAGMSGTDVTEKFEEEFGKPFRRKNPKTLFFSFLRLEKDGKQQ